MAEANPFETTTRRGRRYEDLYGYGGTGSAPQQVETGIPPVGGAGSYPGTGINPDGMYTSPPANNMPVDLPRKDVVPSIQPRSTSAPSYSQYAMAGWDQGKWADTTHQTPKYQVGRILSQFPNTPQGAQQAMEQIRAVYPNAQFNGKDILSIPGVGSWDIITGASNGGDAWSWQTLTDEYGNPVGGGDGAGGAGQGYGGGAFGDEIRAKISQLMNQPGNGIDSPVYQQAMRAYNNQSQRDTASQRNAIAERMAASGQANSGAMDSQLLGAEQAGGEARANFAGQLGLRAMEQQREEIMQALQLGAGLMTDQQRLALTEKLALLDNELQSKGLGLQQQQITNQNNQYNSNMGWEQAQYTDMMNRIPWSTIFGA